MRNLGQAITVLRCANHDIRGNPSEGRIVCLVFYAIPGHWAHSNGRTLCRFVRVPSNNSTSIVVSINPFVESWGLTFILGQPLTHLFLRTFSDRTPRVASTVAHPTICSAYTQSLRSPFAVSPRLRKRRSPNESYLQFFT